MSGIKDLAAKGRNGDNTLMHVSTDEVAGLNALARDMMGQELTTNPETGLPEAFLFAPLAAPMVAGGLGLGGSALAIGATAGALGAAESELRGMDDPLRRGLYSGLTAGAASGIGNALSGAAEAGSAAGQAGSASGQAATTGAPDIGAAVKGAGSGGSAGTGFNVTNPAVSGQPSVPTGELSLAGSGAGSQAPTTSLANSSMTQVPGQAGQTMSSVAVPNNAASQFPSGGNFGVTNPSAPTQSALGQYGDAPQMFEGAKNVFRDEGVRQQFMQQARAPIAAGAVGLGGQAQMRAQDQMQARKEDMEAEREAELQEAQNRIRANYASVGRPMPTGFGGQPLFAGGGIVNLRRGGSLGDGGGRAANNGGMSGGSSRSSSSGGGGGGRPSSHPGRPGGESGTRSLTRSGGGGGGSSAAVQAPQQLDNQAIENAVIGPGDRLAQGINSLAQLSPLVRTLSYLGRDRRALGGSSGHAPGAPRAGQPSIDNSDVGGGGNAPSQPSTPIPTTQPTLPLVAEPTPTPNQDKFLAALQQGMGNQAAMQQTGYTGMAGGGYLDGGMLPGDGMSDDVPASIDGERPAALSSGEFVIPADVVSHIGNGSSDSGAKELYAMMDRIREARTGEDDQAPEINAKKMLPK